MAKELPYFKFFVSEWNDGKIVDCSMAAQGLFINICSLYWSREGTLDNATAKRKLCQSNAKAYKELISAKIIKVSGGMISIDFLNEQLAERKKVSDKSREMALKRWKTDAEALREHSQSNADPMQIREEKKREEEIKEEDSLTVWLNDFLKRKSSNTMELRSMVEQWKKAGAKDIEEQIKAMKLVYQAQGLIFPTKIQTLTQSFMDSNWVEKLKEIDPERVAESNGRPKTYEAATDDIGTSAPGSLG